MKKYLLSALALPLLFACSSEDYLDQKATDNDPFAGIEKVDATFSMAEGTMRFATNWTPEEDDVWGFAWMGDGTNVGIDGKAFQNHNLIQTEGIFTPQTSIYVGKYYLYRPYDFDTKSPQAINFKSLEEQTLAEGYASGSKTNVVTPWKKLAKTAINIGDKWTDVTKEGTETWDKAGIKQHYKINGALFSNQTGLDLKYEKNNPKFADNTEISGATDIKYTIAKDEEVGAADIYDGTVQLVGAAKSFTYAPTKEPANGADHKGIFWTDKKDLKTNVGDYFTWATGDGYDVITLKAADENGVKTEGKTTGWFWFNSLPVTQGNATASTAVKTVLNTSYGAVTVESTIKDCAWAYEDPSGELDFDKRERKWIQLTDADGETADPTKWNVAAHKTFVNYYGNHTGKFALTVDFSKGVMDKMHIKNDGHLQKLLKYYIASGKTEKDIVLNLDATDGVFKISKLSIALLQTINATEKKVLVKPCATHGTPKIIVTQDGQKELGLADATEVPSLKWVFYGNIDVYLSSEDSWTWSGGEDGKAPVTTDAFIKSIINEGTLTVYATNVQASYNGTALKNAAGATMNITQVTTVKSALTNLGTINVGSSTIKTAELRAYNAEIKNDATGLTAHGVINNFGVIGSTSGTTGEVNNYGLINMMNNGAMTLLKSNEIGTDPFKSEFADGNKMGTVVLPENNPTAIVSVANKDANGFIKYTWTGKTYKTPEGNVKYNTIVVSDDITFTTEAEEIQYIEFNGKRTQVVNPATDNKLTKLEGIIVNKDASIIIEKNNKIDCADGAFLGTGATVYKGGEFKVGGAAFAVANTTMYLGKWSLDQIVVWGE